MNMQISMVVPFLGKFDLKNQNCKLNLEIWYLDRFEYAEFNTGALFWFRTEIPFLSNYGQKNQKCQFILKFGT